MHASTLPPPAPAPLRDDAHTIGLIGLAHGTSHFFHLLLPPLFPWLGQAFALHYAQLGLLVTVFFVVSGIGQALAGFVVDHLGARPVLFAALTCFAGAGLSAALAQGYAGLVLAAALAGLGNAAFHPVDFTILNQRVSSPRLGHAYAVHGISGNLGWALASVFMAGMATATGNWRNACLAAALLALAVMGLLWWQRAALDDHHAQRRPAAAARQAGDAGHPLTFLRLPSVWMCFAFFFFTTCALSAIQSFASPALQALYHLPLTLSALVVTGYMLSGAAGMVLGGFLAGRAARLEQVIALCLLGAAVLIALAGTGWLPGQLAMACAALAGLGTGLAGPSRDMLIKRAAPAGATGRVYGTVYSGLDIGFAVSAPLFGALMDRQLPAQVFYGSAAALVLGVVTASLIGRRMRPAA